MSKRTLEILVSLIATLMFAYAAYSLAQFTALAAGFPLAISLVASGLGVLHLVILLVGPKLRAKYRPRTPSGNADASPSAGVDESSDTALSKTTLKQGMRADDKEGADPGEKLAPLWSVLYFGWTLALVGLIWLLGPLVGTGVFLLAFFIIDVRTKPVFWIIGPVAMVAGLYLLQSVLPSVRFPEGILQLF